jgi:hypothetical protein
VALRSGHREGLCTCAHFAGEGALPQRHGHRRSGRMRTVLTAGGPWISRPSRFPSRC